MGEDWRRIGVGLEWDWRSARGGLKYTGGGLEEDWRRRNWVKLGWVWLGWVSFFRCSKWLKVVKNSVSRFLPFYPFIQMFQAPSCLANDRS